MDICNVIVDVFASAAPLPAPAASFLVPAARVTVIPAAASIQKPKSDAEAARLYLESRAGLGGEEFLRLIDGVYYHAPDIAKDLYRCYARGKFVLRKLAFGLLPGLAKAAFPGVRNKTVQRERFVRETLGVSPAEVVLIQEGRCDNTETHCLLRAMYRVYPDVIRVPSSFKSRLPLANRGPRANAV